MSRQAWTDKRERQYEHIEESYEDRGVGEDEAEEPVVAVAAEAGALARRAVPE